MPCYYPIDGWRSKSPNENGKYPIVFIRSGAQQDDPLTIGCGRCIGCKLERSRQWAMRCTHEASLHQDNCFITLTYDEKHLPNNASLDKNEWRLFMKRLRRHLYPQKIRFFACGEYGTNTDITSLDLIGRPHYHAILFGIDLHTTHPDGRYNDKYLIQETDTTKLYTSELLQKIWPKGYSTVGECTFQSAAYIARYCLKKITGDESVLHYAGRIPEFSTQSRRPGIARRWFEKYRHDLDKGFVTAKGVKLPPAAYYKNLYKEHYGDEYTYLQERNRQKIDPYDPELSLNRLRVKEKLKLLKIKQLKRQIA